MSAIKTRPKNLFLTKATLLFLLFTAFNTALVTIRMIYSADEFYFFMLWNLFLAWIPYLVSKVIYIRFRYTHKRFTFVNILLLLVWLAFFPNAPYIITDFFHLNLKDPVPLWFDLILIGSFAFNGLYLGLDSLNIIQKIIASVNRLYGWIFAIISLFLGSVGIYIGRYLRWNSWDIITHPEILIKDVYILIFNPALRPSFYVMSLLMFVLLTFTYLATFYSSEEKV